MLLSASDNSRSFGPARRAYRCELSPLKGGVERVVILRSQSLCDMESFCACYAY